MRSEQVKAFIAAADNGSFAAAARQLNSRRSTLSAAVAALEDELNIELFKRSGNRLALTPIGEYICADARRLLSSAQRIESLCIQHKQGVETVLRIARDDALPEKLWREWMHLMQITFSQTSVAVYLVPAQEHQTFIQQNIVDVAVGFTHDTYTQSQLAPVEEWLVASPSHPLSSLPLVEQADLQQHREVCLTYLAQGRLTNQSAFGSHFLGMTSYELIRDAVVEGSGWAFLPAPLVQQAIASGKLNVLPCIQARPVSYLYFKHQGEIGQVATWLRNQIQRQMSR